ncbi:phage terminase, large subunit, PBSX family [Caloranaerobacter azorensis DSM 13643]|uniref:Phage terminase, large subunit, PBSX family n=1 Tax=Caloranaerobacter azorensis DSM 13643 TaxID=1121264 RepID=A0A1M5TVR6_9FIRM|nr:PBSX family phage terminase large subunit [Caloranaerobacter azorensis]SHH54720.1 phage terminase, large subunit, PBSX family [Caloranaerobacter azorensis DSM 13643]
MAKKRKKIKGFIFKPFSMKQKKLLFWHDKGSPHCDKDMVIADGAIRSGKTIAMICSFIRWSLKNFDGENFILAGKTIGALKKNVIGPMLQILNAWGLNYTYNRSENYIVIGNNTYYMYDANNERSQDRLQGLTAAGALADEVALFPQNFVDQMIGRCSVEGAKIFMNCNPGSPHHFIKTEFIDKAKEKNILYLHFTMDDNLSLSEKVKERFRRMFSGVFYKRYILGLWVMAEGLIYDMFDESKHKVRTKDRDYIEYYISCDYGTHNATVFLLWGLCGGKWYLIDEYYYSGRETGKQKTDEEYYKDLVKFAGDRRIKAIIIDPSAASFITCIKKHGKFKVRKAENDVLEGIRNVGTALSELMILFNDKCINTFREFFSYVWDEKAAERGEDKPVKQFDHAMDAMRYFINTIVMKQPSIQVFK